MSRIGFLLHTACSTGKTAKEIRRMIVKQSSSRLLAPTNQRNTLGRTPLHYAAAAGRCDLVTIFCEEFNTEIDAKDNHGYTALLRALEADHLDVVEYLLLRGSRVTGLVNHEGNTALHMLVQTLSKERDTLKLDVFHRLTEQGVDVNGANLKGRRPLWLAVASNSLVFVKALVEFGADVSLPSADEAEHQVTPLQLAERLGHEMIANFLALDRQASATGLFYQHLSSSHVDPLSYSEKSGSELDRSESTTEETPASTSSPAAAPSSPALQSFQATLVVAAFPYTATRHDVLNLAVGEIVTVVRQLSPEWGEGINSSGQRGVFPLPYVVPFSPPNISGLPS